MDEVVKFLLTPEGAATTTAASLAIAGMGLTALRLRWETFHTGHLSSGSIETHQRRRPPFIQKGWWQFRIVRNGHESHFSYVKGRPNYQSVGIGK